MDCRAVQDEILDALAEVPATLPASVEAHLSTCPECARFAARQHILDARLARALGPRAITSRFRSDVRRSLERDRRLSWSDRLPDVVHFASCSAATIGCALLLPFGTMATIAVGATASLVAYVVLAAVRTSFEEAEQQ